MAEDGNIPSDGGERVIARMKLVLTVIASVIATGVLAVIVLNLIVCLSGVRRICDRDELSELDTDFDCILVLGAGVWADGTPSPMLNDRLVVACEAYATGCSDRLIMSGDHTDLYYDEPGTMKEFAIEKGIKAEVIFTDDFGISTYDSIYRAKELYGAEKILIVSQKYHLYRAIYLADALGVEAYGVSANLRNYVKQPIYSAREWAARIKCVAMSVIKPQATYMGDAVDLSDYAPE